MQREIQTMNIRIVLAVVLLASASLSVAAPKGHKITPDKARRIATAKYHGTVTKAPHLEHEDGQWQYEVLIKSGKNLLEVNVNADTGKIGSVEKTSAAGERRE
jgi:uncharacterized membrane protein YkoI